MSCLASAHYPLSVNLRLQIRHPSNTSTIARQVLDVPLGQRLLREGACHASDDASAHQLNDRPLFLFLVFVGIWATTHVCLLFP